MRSGLLSLFPAGLYLAVCALVFASSTDARGQAAAPARNYVPPPPPPSAKSVYPELDLSSDPEKESATTGETDVEPKKAAESSKDAESDKPESTVGPKIMGFGYHARFSYSFMRGTYSDKQTNAASDLEESQTVAITGHRYTLESYPTLFEGKRQKQYAYTLLEYRDEKTDADYWESRKSALMLLGFVWPTNRLIAPVLGLHLEFNKISLEDEDSPEVAKSDVRALVVGVHFRQKIWGTGEIFGVFYEGRFHLLNYMRPSKGMEIELGVGTAQQYGFLRVDFALDYQYQTYRSQRQSEGDTTENVTIDSKSRTTIATATLWI